MKLNIRAFDLTNIVEGVIVGITVALTLFLLKKRFPTVGV